MLRIALRTHFVHVQFSHRVQLAILSISPTDHVLGRYGNSSGRGREGPPFWFENLTAEIWKIVQKINPLPLTLFLYCDKKGVPYQI